MSAPRCASVAEVERAAPQRGDFAVLVPDAHERMSLAVIRSLGRAGYPVHACSELRQAAGCRSRHARYRALCPPPGSSGYLDWLRRYCAAHAIRCIVPTEPVLLALRTCFDEFAPLLPIAGQPAAVFRGINKFELFEALHGQAGGSPALPPLLLLRRSDPLPDTQRFAGLGTPLFLKVDAAHALQGEPGDTIEVQDARAARRLCQGLLQRFDRIVVQGQVPGVGVGAFLLRWNGEILARFMHRRLHEVPGRGWSSYRESWCHDELLRDAERSLQRLDWVGVAMMEYRWDPHSDGFALIEMNGRFWGSLHLALYAGVDFPALLVDAFRGAPPAPLAGLGARVASRDPILEARYVLAHWRRGGVRVGLALLVEYVRLALDPTVRSDLLFPGDRRVLLWQCWQHLVSFARRLRGRGNPPERGTES